MISFIIPSYNNLKHLKNVYASIQKHEPAAEVILLDDGSTDGTWEWIQQQDCIKFKNETRVGHTILYDKGIELATNDIVGILHADMIVGPNYSKNLIKHLKPKTVVCATRIEPPLHPEGKEKIIRDFGMDFDTLDVGSFEEFVRDLQVIEGETTKGMFAPWLLYKKDFQAIGGHDPIFAPFPYEDSDIFQRWILAGYELIQSRDSFVYHLTCRGHRWNEQVGKDDDYYKQVSHKAARNYLRKWGSWIKNDEFQYPVIIPKYNIAFVVDYCTLPSLEALEPWCDRLYIASSFGDTIDNLRAQYIMNEAENTSYILHRRVLTDSLNDAHRENDIVVNIDCNTFDNDDFMYIQHLAEIIKDSGTPKATFELGHLKIAIHSMEELQNNLINV
jgi:glycosyltransferase involved in cell wall biosynthesis